LGDGALELPKRRENELSSVGRSNRPALVGEGIALRPDLELKPAVGTLYGGASAADERVIELVLRLAALALDVHRLGSSSVHDAAAEIPSGRVKARER
jgi:hypothetical protein